MSKPIFYEGQKVFCFVNGEGRVGQVNSAPYGVYVAFESGYTDTYTTEGLLYDSAISPTLYPYDQYLEIKHILEDIPPPRAEGWKPKVGEWCWFWDNPTYNPRIGKFAGYDESMAHPYLTSIGSRWMHCAPFIGELPEHLKEVEP